MYSTHRLHCVPGDELHERGDQRGGAGCRRAGYHFLGQLHDPVVVAQLKNDNNKKNKK
jgi:hypothetical protein